jgi:hypothetical protein
MAAWQAFMILSLQYNPDMGMPGVQGVGAAVE